MLDLDATDSRGGRRRVVSGSGAPGGAEIQGSTGSANPRVTRLPLRVLTWT